MKKSLLKLIWLPLWSISSIMVLIVLSCFVSVVKDSYETKFDVIKKAWMLFGKKLVNNWKPLEI